MYTYVVTACSILLAISIQLQRYMNFSFSGLFKSRILKMAANVMTVEFGMIHHYSSLGKILNLFCAVIWTHTKWRIRNLHTYFTLHETLTISGLVFGSIWSANSGKWPYPFRSPIINII